MNIFKRRRQETAEAEDDKMEMTPMIDVTFLLLIFFLCTINFKILEGKVPSYLPKNVGMSRDPIEDELESIRIRVDRISPAPVLEQLQAGASWTWDESQIQIHVGNKRVQGLAPLENELRRVHQQDQQVKVTLVPSEDLVYSDAVQVVNCCLRAGLTDITFAGAIQ